MQSLLKHCEPKTKFYKHYVCKNKTHPLIFLTYFSRIFKVPHWGSYSDTQFILKYNGYKGFISDGKKNEKEQRTTCKWTSKQVNIRAQLFEDRLGFKLGFFFLCSKAFCWIIFSVILRASNHQLVDKKNSSWNAFKAFKSEFKSRTNPGLS